MVVRDKETAEDLFQDTFIKVINTLRVGNYREEGKFNQWIMRITRNLIIDHFRKSQKCLLLIIITTKAEVLSTIFQSLPTR